MVYSSWPGNWDDEAPDDPLALNTVRRETAWLRLRLWLDRLLWWCTGLGEIP